jgi:N6-adenosine-specific RNA methylase IME4
MSTVLVHYEAAIQSLAAAKNLDEVKDVRNKADAIRLYARQAKNKQLEMDALEIRLRAEHKMGQLRAEEQKHPGGRPKVEEPPETLADSARVLAPPTNAELGIDTHLAARAQRMAQLDETEFEAFLAEVREDGETGVSRVTKRLLDRATGEAGLKMAGPPEIVGGGTIDDLHELARKGRKFKVIYADPPWPYETWSAAGKDRSAEKFYETMTLADIAALPIQALADPDGCALHLWSVNPLLPVCCAMIEKWGFSYSTTSFHWFKENLDGTLFTGLGHWTRANAEIVLLGLMGKPSRYATDVHSVVRSPVTRHSEKPEEVRRRIMRLNAGPYLELFARKTAPGWVSWGNELVFTGEEAR